MQHQLVRLDLGEVEHVVDDHQKRLAGIADGFRIKALFLGQIGVHQQVRHADDAVHRRADLVAHVGEEGRFGAVGGFGAGLGLFEIALDLLHLADVDPQPHAPAIRGFLLVHPEPAPVAQLLLMLDGRAAMPLHPLLEPFLLAAQRLEILAPFQTEAQDILELRAGDQRLRAFGIHVEIGSVAHQQAVVGIVDHEAVRHFLDRGPHAHQLGDVDGKAHDAPIRGAPVLDLEEMAGPQADRHRRNRLRLPARQHAFPPHGGRFALKIDDPLLDHHVDDMRVTRAGGDGVQPLEHREIGRVGDLEQPLGIEQGKAVTDRAQRLPELPLHHLDLLERLAEFGAHAHVLVAHRRHFGPGFGDFVAQHAGMVAELAVGGEQFGLLEFKQPFRRQPGAPFLGQFLGQTHATLRHLSGTFARTG